MRRGLIIALTFIFAVVTLTTGVGFADAATSRVAIISKIEGTVEVQKSGGKKTLKGFKNMSLNEGDVVTTGSKSSVELKFSNGTSTDDTLVLESNSTVTFSKLSTKNGTTTKVKMKKGKAWVDVKSIATKDDEFQLETPTAIMGVRGTNFFVGIDPNTGESVIGLLSGIIQMQSKDDGDQQPQQIYPAQIFFHNPDSGNMIGNMSNQSLEQLLQLTSPDTMRSILDNLAKIQRENEEMLKRLQQSQGSDSQLPLSDEVIQNNIRNLTSAILLAALNKNLISQNDKEAMEDELEKIIQSVNGQIERELDGNLDTRLPNNRYDFELQRKTEEMQEQLERAKKNNGALLKEIERKMEEQRLKNEQERQRRVDEAMQKLLESLNEDEKNRFNSDKERRLEEERNQQRSTPVPVPPRPTSTPTPTPTPTSTPTPTPSWEDEAAPFAVEYVQNGQSTALSYSAGQEALSYMLDEMLVTQGNAQLILTPNVAGSDLTAVTINGEELDNINGSYVWDLPESSSDLYALINVYHPDYNPAETELTLRGIVSYQPPPSWEDEVTPFSAEYVLYSGREALSYTLEETLSYRLDETIVSVGDDQLVFTPSVADSEITSVMINDEELEEVDGSYVWYLPAMSTEFVATIRVDHVNYGPTELTLHGIVSYEPPPSWEDEAAPFAVEYVQNGQSTALSYSAGQEALSYMLDEMLVTQGNAQLILTPNVAGADLTAVTINGEELENVKGSYVWDLPESSSDLYALINVYHPDYNPAETELTLRGIVAYEPPPSWEDEVTPFSAEYVLYSGREALSYTLEETLSYRLDETIVSVGDDQLVFTPSVADAEITSVMINDEELAEVNGSYVWYLPAMSTEFVATIRVDHVNYGPTELTLHGIVSYEPPPSWEDEAAPFVVEYVQDGQRTSLSYSAGQEALSYMLDEMLVTQGNAQLILTPNVAGADLTAVTINGVDVQKVNGSYVWDLPESSSDLYALINVYHPDYNPAETELTLRGIVSYQPPPSWEDELTPFSAEYVLYSGREALSYTLEETLSYRLDETIVSVGDDQLVFTTSVAGAEITSVMINDEELEEVDGSYAWNLPAMSTEFVATIMVNHVNYGPAELTLRGIVSYEPPPSWEDEAAPFTLEYMLHGYKKTLDYSVSQQDALSFILGDSIITQGTDQLIITPNVADASIMSVSINGQSLQGGVDRYMWALPEEASELVIEIEMYHPQYGNEVLTIIGDTTYQPPLGWADIAYPLIIEYEIGEEQYAQLDYTATYEQGAFHIQIPEPILVKDVSMLRIYTPGDEYEMVSANIDGEQYAIDDNMVGRGLGPFDMLVANIMIGHSVYGTVNISLVIETVPDQTDMPVALSFGGPGMAMEEYQPIYYYIEGYGEEYEGVISFSVDNPYEQPYLRIMPNKYSIVSLIYEVDGGPIEIAPGNAENGLLLQEIVVVNEYTNYLLTVQDNDTLEQKVYKIDGYFHTGL